MAFGPVSGSGGPPGRAATGLTGSATDGAGANRFGRGERQVRLATGSMKGEALRPQGGVAEETTGTLTAYG